MPVYLDNAATTRVCPEATRADVDALAGGLTEITKTRIAAR